MDRRMRGLALMLLSLILMMGFGSVGWIYVFDLSICWQHLFMLLGVAGFVMVWMGEKKNRS